MRNAYKTWRYGSLSVAALAFFTTSAIAQSPSPDFRFPAGFEITEYSDSHLANDIFSMTLDPRGRIVVSGRGYIRILVDEHNEGKASRAIEFAAGPREGAQGMLWEGNWLYFTADGGLRRYAVASDGDHAAGPSELVRAMKTGGEHSSHAIKRGPDGWLYVLGGNNSGIDRSFATLPTSPIREPIAGCLLRFTPDLKNTEIVADGFRNPYDMDFNADGELFTFDSDNERCVSLPWYEGTRFYHVLPAGHYGWLAPQRTDTWRRPPYFADIVAPLLDLGRGSPTGVVCYRHVQFPEHYQGGFFLCDWTFGRVYFISLERKGSTYSCHKEIFLQSVGDNGFAPTAALVHPVTGDLFIAIGGRGTRGAVYRIRYPKRAQAIKAAEAKRWRVPARSLQWSEATVRDATQGDALARRRALEMLRRWSDKAPAALVHSAILANWDSSDRYVRLAAANLIRTIDQSERARLGQVGPKGLAETTYCLGVLTSHPDQVLKRATTALKTDGLSKSLRLAWIRLAQLALGDLNARSARGSVWEGYSLRGEPQSTTDLADLRAGLRRLFPTGDGRLDREISRTLAALRDDDPAFLAQVVDRLGSTTPPIEDIHYLIVLARLRGPRSPALTERTAHALISLDKKLNEAHAHRDRNWPLRIAEMHAELARHDPNLNTAILAAPEFGRPDHALFARCPGFDRLRAAERFLKRFRAEGEDFTWTSALVALVGELPPEESIPLLRRLWGKAGLDEAILPALARHPDVNDRSKYLEGLKSPSLATIRLCITALEKLPPPSEGLDALAVLRCLRAVPEGKEARSLREHTMAYLQKIAKKDVVAATAEAWTAWFNRKYPGLADRLSNIDGVDVEGWKRRLDKVDWASGAAERGKTVFTKANCASCHSGSQAIGPDLRGIAGRFSRADLFTAILQPSKDISPRYRTTLIATENGKIYQGLIIYEAVDGLLLQTGPAATVRIPGDQISYRKYTDTSLMPVGLIDKLADAEIADLYAYLKALK